MFDSSWGLLISLTFNHFRFSSDILSCSSSTLFFRYNPWTSDRNVKFSSLFNFSFFFSITPRSCVPFLLDLIVSCYSYSCYRCARSSCNLFSCLRFNSWKMTSETGAGLCSGSRLMGRFFLEQGSCFGSVVEEVMMRTGLWGSGWQKCSEIVAR